MALDKLVDSTQLDSDLTSVANAIRTKGGTSASLAFPVGFVSAIDAIPTGGGGFDFFDASQPSGAVSSTVTSIPQYCVSGRTGITSISLPNLIEIPYRGFYGCTSVQHIDCGVATIAGYAQQSFYGCSALQGFALKCPSNKRQVIAQEAFRGCSSLQYLDLMIEGTLQNNGFYDCSNLTILVLRRPDAVSTLSNINWFTNTPFASGKSGGTLYVPSSLISSYQSATNWSTILGYTNNKIKSIESTHTDPNSPIDLTLYYVDGTPIPTT